jgi:peptidoglycan/xylan/chitin deacetylase (PgdA/CDA1 family)
MGTKERMRQPLRRLYLLYHELRAGGSAYSYVMDTGLFGRHLELFAKLRATDGAELWPEVTFDDGHGSNLELAAPALAARGMTARFFITVGWTGTKAGYMGWAELRALQAAGHTIGGHGWSHRLLTHCSDAELERELGATRRALEDGLGVAVTTMSLPGGRCDARVLAACAAAGYAEVYTSVPRAEALPLGATVGRLNILGDAEVEWMERLLDPASGVLAGLERKDRLKAAAKRVLGDRLYARLWALANRQESRDEAGAE